MNGACDHNYPGRLLIADDGIRARCTNCGTIGPVRRSAEEARRALRDSEGANRSPPASPCNHRGFSVAIERVEGGHRARCLGCGAVGPVRDRPETAWNALVFRPGRY
ncbi:hypothetical protein E0L93_10285 [Rubrobacter taiwanensis]|uniref:Uncharacterized protein n=1 Tax=Rubrobacter taiwanensis TaxID=185139 RepID=A0A4R1BGA9_9ACTN|nr:hypothetical protein [Rubrobacter taiwanensis]TCJ16213.1 hypothetical protein E0L93_10285 [Rubrobacter taiwanensis]